jgi:hypothetical protein
MSRVGRSEQAVSGADSVVRSRLVDAGLTPSPGSPAQLGAMITAKLQENRELARVVGPIWQ